MHINEGSELRWRCFLLMATVLSSLAVTLPTSFGQEILLYTQQPYNITDNRTLVAEDVDPRAGVVWLKLYSGNQTLKSALVSVGGPFIYNNTNLTVSKIYEGRDRDLVELKINNNNYSNCSYNNYIYNSCSFAEYNNSYYNTASLKSSERQNPLDVIENGSTKVSTHSPTSMKSPGQGAWALLLAVVIRRFIKAR